MQESTVYRSIQREVQEERDRTIALNLLREGKEYRSQRSVVALGYRTMRFNNFSNNLTVPYKAEMD